MICILAKDLDYYLYKDHKLLEFRPYGSFKGPKIDKEQS